MDEKKLNREIITKIDVQELYDSYKQGWLDGVRLKKDSMPEPKHMWQYELGFVDGSAAFKLAMQTKFAVFEKMGEEK